MGYKCWSVAEINYQGRLTSQTNQEVRFILVILSDFILMDDRCFLQEQRGVGKNIVPDA